MNKISFLLTSLLIVVLFQGCKKDSAATKPQQKTYLVKTITSGGRVSDVFTYDDRNRMKTWRLPDIFDYTFTYDDQDRLTKVQTYEFSHSLITYVTTYSYEDNKIHVTKKYDYQDTHTIDKQTFELLNNRIVKASYDEDNSYYTTFKYDDRGNIISANFFDEKHNSNFEELSSYDTNKGAFSMVRGANVFFFLGTFSPRAGYTNNAIESRAAGEPVYSNTTYQYNADGFPVSGVTKFRDYSDDNFTYEYIIK